MNRQHLYCDQCRKPQSAADIDDWAMIAIFVHGRIRQLDLCGPCLEGGALKRSMMNVFKQSPGRVLNFFHPDYTATDVAEFADAAQPHAP